MPTENEENEDIKVKNEHSSMQLLAMQTDRWRQETPEASVVPTPLRPQSVVMAASMLGSFLKAFLDSVWTARGVLMRTKLVSWG